MKAASTSLTFPSPRTRLMQYVSSSLDSAAVPEQRQQQGGGRGEPPHGSSRTSRRQRRAHTPTEVCLEPVLGRLQVAQAALTPQHGDLRQQQQRRMRAGGDQSWAAGHAADAISTSAGGDSPAESLFNKHFHSPPPNNIGNGGACPPPTCFWMPSVMSTWVRMQLTHMLVGLGAMVMPHRQHSLRGAGTAGAMAGAEMSAANDAPQRGACLPPPPAEAGRQAAAGGDWRRQ